MQAGPYDRIVLTGFMGSGKTTVGQLLAARLGWTFVDLDDEISRHGGLTVPAIFATHGEAHFRREEARALAECLTQTNIVLALGGGAPETEASRELLRLSPSTAVVYLEGPFDILQARCLAQAREPNTVVRPLLADADLARKRFRLRAPLYEEIATTTLPTGDHTPAALAEALHSLLSQQKPEV